MGSFLQLKNEIDDISTKTVILHTKKVSCFPSNIALPQYCACDHEKFLFQNHKIYTETAILYVFFQLNASAT